MAWGAIPQPANQSSSVRVRTYKTPCEQNESGYPSIADMRADIDWCLLLVHNSCQSRRSKRHLYSITSSARESSVGGTSRPSALAVLRLITSSYLVGTWTGRSAGFRP